MALKHQTLQPPQLLHHKRQIGVTLASRDAAGSAGPREGEVYRDDVVAELGVVLEKGAETRDAVAGTRVGELEDGRPRVAQLDLPEQAPAGFVVERFAAEGA